MGISIKGKGGGARVTIDGKPVIEKLDFKNKTRRMFTDVGYEQLEEKVQLLQINEDKFIVIINGFIYTFTYNTNNGSFSPLLKIGQNNFFTLTDLYSGYRENKFYLLESRKLEELVYKEGLSSFERTILDSFDSYTIKKFCLSEDKNTIYEIGGFGPTYDIYSLNKTTSLKTLICSFKTDETEYTTMDVLNIIFYKNKLYCFLNERRTIENNKYDIGVYEIDIEKSTATRLFGFIEKFNPEFDFYQGFVIQNTSIKNNDDIVFLGKGYNYKGDKYIIFRYIWNIKNNISQKNNEILGTIDDVKILKCFENKHYRMYLLYKTNDKLKTGIYLVEPIYIKTKEE